MLEYFQQDGNLIRCSFYIAANDMPQYNTLRPLLDWLGHHGYIVKAKIPVQQTALIDRASGANIRVELTVDALDLSKNVDRIILCSGDGAFVPLVDALQRRGSHVSVLLSIRTKPAMAASELRRQADTFLELNDLRPRIEHQVRPNKTMDPK